MKSKVNYLRSKGFKRDLMILGVLIVLWIATGGTKMFG